MRIASDAIPGSLIPMWFKPIKTGTYESCLRPALRPRPLRNERDARGRHAGGLSSLAEGTRRTLLGRTRRCACAAAGCAAASKRWWATAALAGRAAAAATQSACAKRRVAESASAVSFSLPATSKLRGGGCEARSSPAGRRATNYLRNPRDPRLI